MARDGPSLVRPVPRRPNVPVMCATSPDDDAQSLFWIGSSYSQTDLSVPRLHDVSSTPSEATSPLIRPSSFRNLTLSTLMGIYSQAKTSRDHAFGDDISIDTPLGTGAQTPLRPYVDDATCSLSRHLPNSRRSSASRPIDTASTSPKIATAVSLAFRAALLFLLGMGYGILVTRLHSENQHLADLTDGIVKPQASWGYLTFWGASGVVLGSLLPWLDNVCEDTPASESDAPLPIEADAGYVLADMGTDWVLVMRAIGAFVGIVFAIRKLAWASNFQVSLSLALVNPLLWWLIDRSKPGFFLSASVGLAGSIFLLGVKPRMPPAPTMMPWQDSETSGAGARAGFHNATFSSLSITQGVPAPVLGGVTSRETIEMGVWMLSILFCSCVCFGNIGRRLAWSRNAGGKGRWGGVR